LNRERATLTVEEVGSYLGLGRSATYEALRRGDIPHLRIGRRFLVPRAALDRLLAGEGVVPRDA
jgi:excisionase family DNA binding protein